MIKFEYNKKEYETLCDECMMNEEEQLIFKLRCLGNSNTQILMILEENGFPISQATLSRKIKVIDKKVHKVIEKRGN